MCGTQGEGKHRTMRGFIKQSTLHSGEKQGQNPGWRLISGGLAPTADEIRQGWNEALTGDTEPAAQIIPETHAELGAGLGKTQESIAAIAARMAPRSSARLAAGCVGADIVLGTIGMQRYFWPLHPHQQFSLIGMQPSQETIQGREAGTATED